MLLTIGITSYNRPREVGRCIDSIKTKYNSDIEVIVCEDCSPKREEIRQVCENRINNVKYKLIFHPNESNLGYDRNLKNIIANASGKYIFFMSDDDTFIEGAIDKIVELLKDGDYGVVYSAFYLPATDEIRRYYNSSYTIEASSVYAAKHVYDSILFSGLIFKKDAVASIDAEPFLNKIYFQVYLYLYCICRYGGYYLNIVSVEANGDGENGFGTNESSDEAAALVDRSSLWSYPEYHKRLIFCIKKFDNDYGENIIESFRKEYSLRSIVILAKAETQGKKVLKQYWKKINDMDMKLTLLAKCYYLMLFLLGAKMTLTILKFPKRILLNRRNER